MAPELRANGPHSFSPGRQWHFASEPRSPTVVAYCRPFSGPEPFPGLARPFFSSHLCRSPIRHRPQAQTLRPKEQSRSAAERISSLEFPRDRAPSRLALPWPLAPLQFHTVASAFQTRFLPPSSGGTGLHKSHQATAVYGSTDTTPLPSPPHLNWVPCFHPFSEAGDVIHQRALESSARECSGLCKFGVTPAVRSARRSAGPAESPPIPPWPCPVPECRWRRSCSQID